MGAPRPSPTQKIPWGWREAVYAAVFVGGLLVILPTLNPGAAEYEDSFLWFVGMLVLVVGLTEVTQFVLMRAFGARVRLRPKWSVGLGPVLVSWWTAEGHGFTAK